MAASRHCMGRLICEFSFHCSYNCWSFFTTVLSCVFLLFVFVSFYNLQALILLGLGDHIYRAFKGQVLEGSVICFAWSSVDGYWKGSGKGRRKRELAAKRKKKPIKNIQNENMYLTYCTRGNKILVSNVFVSITRQSRKHLFKHYLDASTFRARLWDLAWGM
ncbi:hypothetical protein TRIATDRAFT_254555 [Trichoderma atroviride IMI 206040]|uniref:Uncharacterized protein n=1 Tax=Hypocrea atroviridis (strain ATCC 20476 / IMI 206040) TaxID=452589 RepID=G9NGR9_HYPAI|nr:uncharacterized protein TRIATDRAFT_297233 [Trichoderma atroviride IMI 206040]EHK50480.1 hypothetical protein TRIATDRAFT_254555 [Trichoderma atroviride IMI 206040]